MHTALDFFFVKSSFVGFRDLEKKKRNNFQELIKGHSATDCEGPVSRMSIVVKVRMNSIEQAVVTSIALYCALFISGYMLS